MDRARSRRLDQKVKSLLLDDKANRQLAWCICIANLVTTVAVLIVCIHRMHLDRVEFTEAFSIAVQSPDTAADIFKAVRVVDAKVLIALIAGTVAQLGATLVLIFTRGRSASQVPTGIAKKRTAR